MAVTETAKAHTDVNNGHRPDIPQNAPCLLKARGGQPKQAQGHQSLQPPISANDRHVSACNTCFQTAAWIGK